MPSWGDYFRFSKQYANKRNLEEGLFQIASQTCNILVKVNNTNNINLVRNNRSDEFGCAGPPSSASSKREMQISIPKFRKSSILSGCTPNLSTVLESSSVGNASSSDEEIEQWEQIFMMRDENGNPYNDKRKKRSIWCRPSCIPVCIVIILIILVVLVPLLDQANSPNHNDSKKTVQSHCSDNCRVHLVETIPEGHMYPPDVKINLRIKDAWLDLIEEAESTIDIASFYWTLRYNEVYPHNSSMQGEEVFKALYKAGTERAIKLRIAQNIPSKVSPNIDTEILVKKKAAQVRSLNFSKLLGGGVLHTKFWIVDSKHFYIGSANMDWRSLTQVKELGIVVFNCSCLARDLNKIFEVYWEMGANDAKIPESWPARLSTDINIHSQMNVTMNDESYNAFITSSPPPMSPAGRTNDDDAIIEIIQTADKFVYISVMDYSPIIEYGHKVKFWPKIDDAIRHSAIENKVSVKMLISWWNHSNPVEDYFLRSLVSLNDALQGIDIEVRRFVVPATKEQAKIPFGRVNHNKYMVTDKVAYIGTSNWYGDYFIDTAGVAFVLSDKNHHQLYKDDNNTTDIREELVNVFERDWYSPYALPLKKL